MHITIFLGTKRNGFHGMLFSYDDGPSMEKDFLYDVAQMNSMDLGYTFWQERECLGEKKST